MALPNTTNGKLQQAAAHTKMVEAQKQANRQKTEKTTYAKKAGSKIDVKKQPEQKGAKNKLLRYAKIDTLPKDVRTSLPFRGITDDGIIETNPGTFTRCYKLADINFTAATGDEQMEIYQGFCNLLNSLSETIRWEITIFNHSIDKAYTLNSIKIKSKKDGLNRLRNELNQDLVAKLVAGGASVTTDKYFTVALDDIDAAHAIRSLHKLDVELEKAFRAISPMADIHPLEASERARLLYDIYNQDTDYRLETRLYDDKINFNAYEKRGITFKDMIGPTSFNWGCAVGHHFMMGETYCKALYVNHVPTMLSTDFISDLSDIQHNLLISYSFEKMSKEKAVKMVNEDLSNTEGNIAKNAIKNAQYGVFGVTSAKLENSRDASRELLDDLQKRNQNMFFVSIVITCFADSKEHLDDVEKLVKSVAEKHQVSVKGMDFQQEFAFNTCLPLCRNDIFVNRTFTTEAAAILVPYHSQEVNHKNPIFYGQNQTTRSMILYDRTQNQNYNGLIFGSAGSGKSFTAKLEMVSALLSRPDAQIFVIDPMGEYSKLASALNGEVIDLKPGARTNINPLDLNISSDADDEVNPLAAKAALILTLFDIIIGQNRELSPSAKTIIDKATKHIYTNYINELYARGVTYDYSICPTLMELYAELKNLSHDYPEASTLADYLYRYAVGSGNTFAHKTNFKTNSRFIVYKIDQVGDDTMKELAEFICVNDIWNRMIENSKNEIYTWMYIDEFHILLENKNVALNLKRFWKMARKLKGVPTGITQNTNDLLRDTDTLEIFNNTNFMLLLKSEETDQRNLQQLLHLSDTQLGYITNSNKGSGLFYNGKIKIPFDHNFPKDTELYKLLTTAHDV